MSAHVSGALARQNLADLGEQYFSATAAGVAVLIFAPARQDDPEHLGWLLRDHRVQPVNDAREFSYRDAFDDLLAYYSVLEIACMLGYVSSEEVKELDSAASILSDPAVRAFYEEHYPLLLPRMFRNRLRTDTPFVLPADQVHLPAFLRFLDLNATLNSSVDVEMFMALLDGYSIKSDDRAWDMADVANLLGSPEEFAHRISKLAVDRDAVDSAVNGFRIYLRFCRGFDELLSSLDAYPVQQSALWNFHGYWFDSMRARVGESVHVALRTLAMGSERDEADDDRDADAHLEPESDDRSVQSMHVAIRRLVSGRYAWVLREAAEESAIHVNPAARAHPGKGEFLNESYDLLLAQQPELLRRAQQGFTVMFESESG